MWKEVLPGVCGGGRWGQRGRPKTTLKKTYVVPLVLLGPFTPIGVKN